MQEEEESKDYKDFQDLRLDVVKIIVFEEVSMQESVPQNSNSQEFFGVNQCSSYQRNA